MNVSPEASWRAFSTPSILTAVGGWTCWFPSSGFGTPRTIPPALNIAVLDDLAGVVAPG